MTKEDHNGIELEYLRDYALIRFNRPATRNSLSRTTLDTLDSLFSLVSEQPAIKSILFTGIEDVFASGADLREIAALDEEKAAEFSRRGQDLFQRIASS